jgi:peptide/nickel transport system permease protein
MLPFIIRRLVIAVLVLLVSTFLVFVMASASGNPLATLQSRQPPPPPSTIKALENQLHLNDPIPVRYAY